jgi:hypothetical protein
MKTLNVKKTTRQELWHNWGFDPLISNTTSPLMQSMLKGEVYIRCNSKGQVNWDKAPLYHKAELDNRGKVKIH